MGTHRYTSRLLSATTLSVQGLSCLCERRRLICTLPRLLSATLLELTPRLTRSCVRAALTRCRRLLPLAAEAFCFACPTIRCRRNDDGWTPADGYAASKACCGGLWLSDTRRHDDRTSEGRRHLQRHKSLEAAQVPQVSQIQLAHIILPTASVLFPQHRPRPRPCETLTPASQNCSTHPRQE